MQNQTRPEPTPSRQSRRRFKHPQQKPPDSAKIVTIVGTGVTVLATLILISLLD